MDEPLERGTELILRIASGRALRHLGCNRSTKGGYGCFDSKRL